MGAALGRRQRAPPNPSCPQLPNPSPPAPNLSCPPLPNPSPPAPNLSCPPLPNPSPPSPPNRPTPNPWCPSSLSADSESLPVDPDVSESLRPVDLVPPAPRIPHSSRALISAVVNPRSSPGPLPSQQSLNIRNVICESVSPQLHSQQRPQMRDLVFELRTVACNWHSLGVQLGVPYDRLDKIDEDFQTADRKLHEVLSYWLLNAEDPSWDEICEALRRVGGLGNIVRHIMLQYCSLTVLRRFRTDCQQSCTRPDEFKDFTCRVREDVQVVITGLQNDFEKCVCIIRSSMGSTSVERIKELLRELPAGEVKGQVGCLLSRPNNYDLIMASTDVHRLFMNLSNIHAWDFLHPQLLDYLVQRIGEDIAKSSLEEYKSRLLHFRMTTSMSDLLGWMGNIPENELFQKLVVKLGDNWKDRMYQEFEEMRISLLRQQVFVQSSLSLCGVLSGSILVIMVTPVGQVDISAIERALKIEPTKSALQRTDISGIYVEGLCVYRDNVDTAPSEV